MIATIYDASTGRISRTVVGSYENVIAQLDVNETYIDGDYPSNKFVIMDGQPVEIQISEAEAFEIASNKVRSKRDQMLLRCDWSQLPDVSDTIRDKYIQYRQALRDVPNQSGFPYNVTWPEVSED